MPTPQKTGCSRSQQVGGEEIKWTRRKEQSENQSPRGDNVTSE